MADAPLTAADLAKTVRRHKRVTKDKYHHSQGHCAYCTDYDVLVLWPCDAARLVTELQRAWELLDQLTARIPLSWNGGDGWCVHCHALVAWTGNQWSPKREGEPHAADCPWKAARAYRAAGR